MVRQYEIYWVNLDPTIGREIKKTRPSVVISPDEMNNGLATVLVAPLTSTIKKFPFRANCVIDGKNGSIVLDQIRAVDKSRLLTKISKLNNNEIQQVKSILEEMLIK